MKQLVSAWLNFFDFCKNPGKFPLKPPSFKNSLFPVYFPKRAIKIEGSCIKLCYPTKHRIGRGKRKKTDLKFFTIDTGLKLSDYDIREVGIVPKYSKFFELHIIYKKKR